MLRGVNGSGGGAPVGGSGTSSPSTIPRWTGPSTLGDSGLIDDGSQIYTTSRVLAVNTATTLGTGLIRFQVGSASALANYQGAQAGFMLPAGSGSWVEFCENSTNGTTFRISKDASTGVVLNANGKNMGFNASGYTTAVASSQMVLLTSGNVGIGTASPTQKLTISGASSFLNAGTDGVYGDIAFIGSSSYPTTYLHKIKASVSNTTTNALLTFALNSGPSAFTDVMTLRGDGNVGIGTANPGAILHTLGTGTTTGIFATSSANAWVELRRSTSTTLGYIGTGSGLVTGGAAADLAFRCESGNLLFSTVATERARIDSNGNIYGTSGTTGMTNGFFYIPAAAGAPTGTPTAVSGRVPMYYDTTNNQFYVYNGAWKKVTLA